MINVIPNMNCRFSFSSPVNVASMLPHYGTNHTRWQEYRYRDENYVANLLIFWSSGIAGNASTVFLENIIFI